MARARRRRRKKGGGRGFAGLVLGLAVGLSVAGWLWLNPRQGTVPATPPAPAPAEAPAPLPEMPEPPPGDDRFEFYDTLPSFEVVVPESQPDGTGTPPPISRPGTYVLQAGSYPEHAQADSVKARLALLGVSSQIQAVTVDGRRFHRVRIGPVENLDELNRLRERLRQNRIEFLVIQVRE